jgi:hypothetical protein
MAGAVWEDEMVGRTIGVAVSGTLAITRPDNRRNIVSTNHASTSTDDEVFLVIRAGAPRDN